MREQLIEKKAQLETQIRRIDNALKFFDEHPEMENVLSAYMALMGMNFPAIGPY